ncbi:MAG: signal peptide peptidase SppA [Phycisphaerales bacterium]|nr:MAG: signal peptide peptidase SppA [Phycisphaerales bacterium]
MPPAAAARRGSGWRVFWGIVLVLSIMANIALVLMLVGVVAMFATGPKGLVTEEVIRTGPRTSKIVVVNLQGIIHGEQAKYVYTQLKAAGRDRLVKGVIVRINSSGGTISGSDQIYKEIQRFREEEGVPVVAFMQGIAASGGYYASVACEKIVAEPTTITGSIGVMMGHFVFQELLESKLGIVPVIITEGKKKNWPSSFKTPTEEELQYLRDKILTPAYERFVEVVIEGREGILTPDDVRRLADGGILTAPEAKREKLIDEVGYLDDAIELVKSLADIKRARVVEYRRAFSLTSLLSYRSRSVLNVDRTTLYELGTPQILYLWSAY